MTRGISRNDRKLPKKQKIRETIKLKNCSSFVSGKDRQAKGLQQQGARQEKIQTQQLMPVGVSR